MITEGKGVITMSGHFRNLVAWQKGHAYTLAIYEALKDFPDSERFGLISQMRRAAYSIGMNLAEGSGRATVADKAHFVTMAMGSARECEYQLILAHDLGYMLRDEYEQLTQDILEVQRLLVGYRQYLMRED